jgi:hypothetical protein
VSVILCNSGAETVDNVGMYLQFATCRKSVADKYLAGSQADRRDLDRMATASKACQWKDLLHEVPEMRRACRKW